MAGFPTKNETDYFFLGGNPHRSPRALLMPTVAMPIHAYPDRPHAVEGAHANSGIETGSRGKNVKKRISIAADPGFPESDIDRAQILNQVLALRVRYLASEGQNLFFVQIVSHAVAMDSWRFVIAPHPGRSPACRQPLERDIGGLRNCDQIGGTGRRSVRTFPLNRRARTDADLPRQLRAAQSEHFPRMPNAPPQGWRRMPASSDSAFHAKELLTPVRMTFILALLAVMSDTTTAFRDRRIY